MSNTQVAERNQSFSLAPQNITEALEFANMMSKSNLVPKEFTGNPGNILVAIQWGSELGLQPMQAMQNIAVINGRPSLWGDSVIALVKASPVCEYVVEETTDAQAVCRVKRRGEPEQVRVFTVDDAKKAGLYGKQGPWTQYPKRMLQMRARSWALRDVFPDVLRGMPIAEELMDIPVEGFQGVTGGSSKPSIEECTADKFNENRPKWQAIVESKKKSADDLILGLETKTKLTDDQKNEIRSWGAKPVNADNDDFLAGMERAENENA